MAREVLPTSRFLHILSKIQEQSHQGLYLALEVRAKDRNAGSMVAMDGNFPPLAICFVINAKNRGLPPSRIARIAMPSSRGQRHGMGTWSMENASREEARTIDEYSSLTA